MTPKTSGGAIGCVMAHEDGGQPWIREGFYLRITTGSGFFSLRGTGPLGDAKLSALGSAATVTLGASVTRGLVLGATLRAINGTGDFHGGPLTGATISAADGRSVAASLAATASIAQIGLLVDWYPKPTSGWHVSASTGVGSTAITNSATGTIFAGGALAASLSAGYDWAIVPQWSAGIELATAVTSSASLKRDNEDTGYKMRGFWLGVQGSLLYF